MGTNKKPHPRTNRVPGGLLVITGFRFRVKIRVTSWWIPGNNTPLFVLLDQKRDFPWDSQKKIRKLKLGNFLFSFASPEPQRSRKTQVPAEVGWFPGGFLYFSIVAACVHRPEFNVPGCRNWKNLAIGVIERTWPANVASASSASPGQARLRASMPFVVHSNKGLMGDLREHEIVRYGWVAFRTLNMSSRLTF